MLSEAEYRGFLDQPKHTLAKLKSIAQKIVGTVKADLAGKTRAEVIDHLLKNTSLDEDLNINLKSKMSIIGAITNPKARKPRSDKGMPRMKKTKAEPKAKTIDDKSAKVAEVKRTGKAMGKIGSMMKPKPTPKKRSKKIQMDLMEYNP